ITHPEPIPCKNTVPAALVAPVFEFSDPPPVSPCAVEQEILDHHILTQEDIDIQIHGHTLPNLGPNFHTPEALLNVVDFYDTYQTITAAEKKAAKYCKKVCAECIYFLYSSTLQATNDAMEVLPSDTQPEPLPSAAPEVPHMTDAGDNGEEELKFGLHPDDPANFLKLSGALRILMQHTLLDTDIDSADTLIQKYTYALLQMPKESLLCEVAEQMLKASSEERGTVAALAALSKELDEVNADGKWSFFLMLC
ncbi:hypothetical protein F4604DRAFT_1571425, partial [Suillus subluteus]